MSTNSTTIIKRRGIYIVIARVNGKAVNMLETIDATEALAMKTCLDETPCD